MMRTAHGLKKPSGTTLFALATALVMVLSVAARTAAQPACSGFCDAAQTALSNSALNGDGGLENSAFGDGALFGNTGNDNTAVGLFTLDNNNSGSDNTAVGVDALESNTGSDNTAVRFEATQSANAGGSNTATGAKALNANTTGSSNTATGITACALLTGAVGSRIYVVKLPMEIFAERRKRFMEAIAGGVAVLPSAPISVRSNDVEYPYRQDNDFYYLTGFEEPESVAVLAPGNPGGDFILFVRPRDKEREIWTGRRAGVEGAMRDFGADKAYTIDELDRVLPEILSRVEAIYYPLGNNEAMNQRMVAWLRGCQAMRPRSGAGANSLLDPREIVHEMRLFKSPEELELMRRAIAISNKAHQRAMREARGGIGEWAVEAAINHTFRASGSAGPSYPSIVASGPNATVLHYINNDREMQNGELLLIDAGCEYQFYASDITRTFPVGARFNAAQRDLYQLVLDAQKAAIEAVKPGTTIDAVHEVSVKVLAEGMRSLKLLNASVEEILSRGAYRQYYMHRTSHWLGMDVHDVGHYRRDGKPRQLEPAMVLTAEPGIYIALDDEEAPAEMRGIGIRIEDDVLVTPGGYEVLSCAVPKQISEVEALTAG